MGVCRRPGMGGRLAEGFGLILEGVGAPRKFGTREVRQLELSLERNARRVMRREQEWENW